MVKLTNKIGGLVMCKVNIYDLKTNFSKYIELLEKGKEEEIIVSRYGKKVARITLYNEEKKTKRLGAALGKLEYMPFSLEDPDDEIAKSFGY